MRAVRLGTVASAAMAAFAYLYMAASWGAYVFISNLIPLYVLMMIAIRRYHRYTRTACNVFDATHAHTPNHVFSVHSVARAYNIRHECCQHA